MVSSNSCKTLGPLAFLRIDGRFVPISNDDCALSGDEMKHVKRNCVCCGRGKGVLGTHES